MALHISIAAEKVGVVAGMPITNSLLTTWIVMGILFVLALIATRRFKKIPSYGQLVVELVVGGLYDFFETILGHNIKKVFPLIASLFLFVLFANWAGLIPGVGTIGFFETVHGETKMIPLFRGPTADINTTLALALVTMLFVQVFGIANLGVSYLSKFFNFKNPIFTFVGILELVSEISRVISFTFRLFGNIFAGEVLLAVMAFLFAFGLPMPFIALEIFVGLIQALVFAMLAAVFLNLAAAGHGGEGH